MRELPRGWVTLVFTDIEGSTRLLDELGVDRYGAVLDEHRSMVREIVEMNGGAEVDTQGDSFFLAFADPAHALAAASAIQRASVDGPFSVRIGVHSGTPTLSGEGYIGPDVHLAARIMAAGHGGQILMSRDTVDAAGVAAEDLGEHRLKDFARPIWLYQLGSERFPPLRAISNTNLPRPASPIIGRATEIAALLSLMRDSRRMLTLTGPGGSGKTRLALEVASEVVSKFRNGVFWLDLAPVRDADLVLDEIGTTIGARGDLSKHIAQREMLIVLDNFEHLMGAASNVAHLVSTCPNLAVLATSREPLRIRAEKEIRVPTLAAQDAVALFVERSGLESTLDISELCRRLDNLPLAVELAAARASALSPAQIIDRLSSRLDLLRGGRDANPRQMTLRATIEWSFGLLAGPEQLLLSRLSVFSGGWDLEAAEGVCDADINLLQSLVDKSLVTHLEDRFGMLESIRQFAAERLAQLGAEELSKRHARWVSGLVEKAEPELEGGSQGVWLERLEREHDNIRTALAAELQGSNPDADLALRTGGACATFWWIRGHWTEGRRWLALALEKATGGGPARIKALEGAAHLAYRQFDYDQAAVLVEEASALAQETGDESRKARLLRIRGLVATGQGREDEFIRLTNESSEAARQSGDDWALLMALNNLGYAELEHGTGQRAVELIDEGLILATRHGDRRSQAHLLENRGFAWLQLGDMDRAEDDFKTSLSRANELAFPEMTAEALAGLAAIRAARGAYVEAALLLAGARRLRAEIGSGAERIEAAAEIETETEIVASLDFAQREAASTTGANLDIDRLVTFALGNGQASTVLARLTPADTI